MNKNNYFSHETAIIDNNVSIGKGTKIWHFSHIQKNAHIGDNCILGQNVNVGSNVKIGNNVKIQNNVSVYEGVELEDYVFCGPSIVFTNVNAPRSEFPQENQNFVKTLVKRSASIGANATIICGKTIGQYALIGAGSVVTTDIPDFALAFGNPARINGWVNEKGFKIEFKADGTSLCGNFYYDGSQVSRKINH